MAQSSGWNLVAVSGPIGGMVCALTEQGVSLGRGDECEVVLPSQNVSRKHARVFLYEGIPYVQDLGSRNGVFVNGMRIQTQGLQAGDTVTMGEFVFQISNGTPAAAKGGGGGRKVLVFGGAAAVLAIAVAAIALQGQGGGGTQAVNAPAPVNKPSQVQNMFANLNEPGKAPKPAGAKTSAPAAPEGGQDGSVSVPADQRTQLVKDYLDRAELFQEAGKITEARDSYERALRLDPTNQKALIRKERLEKEIAAAVQRHLDDGMKSFKSLRYEEAISSWELVLNLAPEPNNPAHQQATKFIADAKARLETQQQ